VTNDFAIINKKGTFNRFVNEKSRNFLGEFKRGIALYCPIICFFVVIEGLFFCNVASEIFSKKQNDFFFNGCNSYGSFINDNTVLLSGNIHSEATISINISRQISELFLPCVHAGDYTEKQNLNLDPQRLSGSNGNFVICDSPIQFENFGGGINKTSRHKFVVKKVTECRETEDQLMRNLLESTASVVNCVGGVNGDVPTEITTADCENICAVLVTSNADYITELEEGQNKFGTGPIRDCFVALSSSSLIPNLRVMANFLHKAQYPKPDSGLTSEYGSVSNIRFLVTSAGSVTANASLLGANVFNTFVVGQESYSSIYLDGETAKFIYHPPGWGDDPAELRSTCAWRFAHARVITNDSWLINLRSTL
jgi:hypothetical protein